MQGTRNLTGWRKPTRAEANRTRGMGLMTEIIDGRPMVRNIEAPETCPDCGAPMDVWVAHPMHHRWVSSPICYCGVRDAPEPPAPEPRGIPVRWAEVEPDPSPLPRLSQRVAPWYVGGTQDQRSERLAALCRAASGAKMPVRWASDTALYSGEETAALESATLLAVSELGAHVPASWELARARDVIETRASMGKPTAVASAYGPADLVRRLGGIATEAAQLVRALAAMCEVVRL